MKKHMQVRWALPASLCISACDQQPLAPLLCRPSPPLLVPPCLPHLLVHVQCSSSRVEAARKDAVSHYILRLAYCRTPELRAWLLTHEAALFRARFRELDRQQQVQPPPHSLLLMLLLLMLLPLLLLPLTTAKACISAAAAHVAPPGPMHCPVTLPARWISFHRWRCHTAPLVRRRQRLLPHYWQRLQPAAAIVTRPQLCSSRLHISPVVAAGLMSPPPPTCAGCLTGSAQAVPACMQGSSSC